MSTITRLAGKTAIVTAASAGIGRGIAIAFAREGANVVLNGRHEARSHEVLARCREAGAAAELLLGDVAAPNTWKGLRQCALDHFGAIDILVNNAAHFFFRSALDTREEDWDKAMEVGVKSAWVGAKTCLPTMIARQSGCILNISSNMGLIGGRDSCGYIAAKGALHNLTLSLAADYGKANIRANTISPGPIASLGNEEVRKNPDFIRGWMGRLALPFYGEPEDVAYAAVYLASDEARFVTGANLVIDGGWNVGK